MQISNAYYADENTSVIILVREKVMEFGFHQDEKFKKADREN